MLGVFVEHFRMRKKTCSSCGGKNDRSPQRYCHDCHAQYQRIHRPEHSKMPPEAQKRANCRSYANTYRRRGLLTAQPCEGCGEKKVQMHHEDYDKPLQVRWLCRACHLYEHDMRMAVEV